MTDRQLDIFNSTDGLGKVSGYLDEHNSAGMVKVVSVTEADDRAGDPVELQPGDARQLACALPIFADRVDGEDGDWRRASAKSHRHA